MARHFHGMADRIPSMPKRDHTVGERIERARRAAQITPSDLARLIGVKPQAIYMLEGGKVNAPTPANLFRIADALGVDPRVLVFGEDAARPPGVAQPTASYSVEQVFDEETLLFARRFQSLDENQRRSWMLSLLLTVQPLRGRTAEAPPPVTLAHPAKKS